MDTIRIRGARTHNLKNIDVDLPRDSLIVITGLSGSGKSSLAFDTVFAEGQRRYVESLSAYARQFLSIMDKPDVDLIDGLSPAIAIEQKSTSHNPRSTVGTITEIYDYLRLLYARAGTPTCPIHGEVLEAQTLSQMVDTVMALDAGTTLALLAPVIRDRKGDHATLLERLRAQGYLRARIDGVITELEGDISLPAKQKHSIDVVVDRFKVRDDLRLRLTESFETATTLGDGNAIVTPLRDDGDDMVFSTRFACSQCGYSLPELEPRAFSFNSPHGACPTCDGLGLSQFFDPALIIVNPSVSLAGGAIRGWDKRNAYYFQMIKSLALHYKFDVDTIFDELPEAIRHLIMHGSGTEKIKFHYQSEKGQASYESVRPFEGIIPNLTRRYKDTESNAVREELGKLLSSQTCPDCKGARLNEAARHVLVDGHSLPSIVNHSIGDTRSLIDSLKLTGQRKEVASKITGEILLRLNFLINVGLDYLSLDRSADTLSGGEAQRIRLASQIGAGLQGVLYVLDEPSIGLHQRDNDKLLKTLEYLRDLGNTVIVVEHDEDAIRAADFVLDIGPGAGVHGGNIVASGTPEQIISNSASITGQYLSGKRFIPIPERKKPGKQFISITKASGNNLKSVNVKFPVGICTVVTGVSGSGKSTLVNDTLYKHAANAINNARHTPSPLKSITGLKVFDKIVDIDQSAIGRTPRSNPATYSGLFSPIRDLFAGTHEARSRGYKAGRFSFNVKGGRCEACQGDGLIKVEMHFLPDVYVPCDVCQGKRYGRETLDIRYKGQNIHQVLTMTVEQAHEFFGAVPVLHRKLATLMDVGLSYITLGQNATTLSGGEAQRIKLARELSKRDTGDTLYILDEPTTGLHFEDVKALLVVIQRLRDAGNTVIIIEHNLDVIKTADWIIDMGPEGGQGGGTVVAAGTPEDIIGCASSYTGQYLKRILSR
ncbi:excinuclease ABC subunit UvrA [Granulosicoccus antarcticus]|uniref:UvrABC system protein A n=1 Tax=Granulosicoccus antarcticus IMCC3135 TaxID=1192854 RepID=A0A2Z2NMY9_9GAMM|nr:excinuclease ABC subunit UvrA [Granulosicoccus antarcticus]ASJ71875.1 UvrABC system protein A [Granulosicoccus antarcticus IMCC3135]